MNPCHTHFKSRVDDIKRGILMAGGFPIELPALSLAESYLKPTTMLYRNMLAMEAEELLRCHPVDGVVLMGGCDKTTPGLLMGATSRPADDLSAGRADAARQLEGQDAGFGLGRLEILGRAARRKDLRQGLGRCRGRHRPQHGTCMTMGTASTMTAIAEAIGMTLPGASSIPAADADHIRMARNAAAASSKWCGRI